MDKEKSWKRLFHVDPASYESGEDHIPGKVEGELVAYTDGSKTRMGTGSGYYVYDTETGEDICGSESLGTMATVFQGEVKAISLAVQAASSHESDKPLTILSDSQAALKALTSWEVSSGTVKTCIDDLNTLAEKRPVTLKWIKAHANHPGNELADEMAKEGANTLSVSAEPRFPLSKATTSGIIGDVVTKQWNEQWRKRKDYRQTKKWFPQRSPAKSAELLKLNRTLYSRVVRWITGHNFLKRHMSLCQGKDEYISPYCRLCKLKRETSGHLLTTCEAARPQRHKYFGAHVLDSQAPTWTPSQMMSFLQYETFQHLEDLVAADKD
jgi:ribonuclease HI